MYAEIHSRLFRSNEEVGSVKFAGKLYQGHGPLPPQEDQEAEEGGLQEEEEEGSKEGGEEGGGDRDGGVARRSSRLVRRNTLEANTGGEVGAANFF